MARNPNFWATPTNRPAKLWNLTWDQYLSLDGAVWKSILIAVSVIIVMTLFNTYELRGINIFLTFLGYAFIWWFGLRPTHMAYSAGGGGIFAALFDRDKSQGVGSGPKVLFGVVKDVSYTFLLVGFSLFTWDFSGHVWAFWVVLAGVIILIQTGNDRLDAWRNRIIIGYTLLCIVASLWTTFGAYSGRAFDPETGAPLYMVDPTTGRIDSEGRGPSDCTGSCFSAETGVKLVPMTKEQALKRNPAAIGASAIDAVKDGVSGISLPSASLGGGGCDITDVRVLATQPGIMGTQFSMKRGCPIRLDASAFQVSGQPRIGVTVRLDPNGPVNVLATGEAALYHAEPWVIDSLGRPYITIVPNDGWPEGVQAIKLIAYSNDTK